MQSWLVWTLRFWTSATIAGGIKCNTEIPWWLEELSGLGPQDKSQKACSPFQKRWLETFHYRDIIPCHRKGSDPVSLNCSSWLDALGFSGFPGTLTQTQEEDICQSWMCWAVCLTELPASPAEPAAATSQETNLSQSQHQLLLPRATTRFLCLDELGFHDVLHRQFPTCPNQNWQTVKDWHTRQQTVREIE